MGKRVLIMARFHASHRRLTASLLIVLLVVIAGCSTGRKAAKKLTPGDILTTEARQHLGCRYRFGGEDPDTGFDCSGLTYYVYGRIGVALPRRARDQWRMGDRVSQKRLMPGDLVFFKGPQYSGYHVGIYVGDRMFIHAPSSGKRVEVQSLDAHYYRRYFRGGRRIVNEDGDQI